MPPSSRGERAVGTLGGIVRDPARGSSRRPRPGDRLHGDVRGDRASAWDEVYRLVRRIPKGRVMTYGQVGTELENRLSPRAVGWAMHGCPEGVPWHRVVNAGGACSTDRLPGFPAGMQRAMLESEGVRFRANGTLDLSRYRWTSAGSDRRDAPSRPKRPSAPRRRGAR